MSQQLEQVPSGAAEGEKKGKKSSEIAGRSPMRIALDRLLHDPVAIGSIVVVALFFLIAIFAPLLMKVFGVNTAIPFNCNVLDCNAADPGYGLPIKGPPLHGFDPNHPFGVAPANGSGVDNLAYWLAGARNSIFIAVMATVFSTIIGLLLGLVAGYAGGLIDRVIGFVTDFFLSIPFLLAALCVSPIIQDRWATQVKMQEKWQFISLVVILSAFGWMYLARLLRGEVLSIREREYVESARLIGMPARRILGREILPNIVAPIVVSLSLGLPAYVTAEAGLSYLGIGLTNGKSWGQIINKAQDYYENYPLYLWEPVLGIVLLVVALNLLGDAIRDALDPKTRR